MTTYTTTEYRALTYYRADVDRIPPLTREEEATLVERLRLARRDQSLPPEVVTAAKQRLVEGLQRLVMFLALKQAPRFVRQDLEDLIQEASLALLEATERCAFVRDSFSGYASYVIRRAFLIARTHDYPVSITRDVLLDLTRRDQIVGNPLLSADPLDTPLAGTDDLVLADTLEAPASLSTETCEHPQKTAFVQSLLAGLSERQRVALRMRYGLDDADGREHSVAEIAAHLGISETATSSLLKHALISCRRLATKWGVVMGEPGQAPLTAPLPPAPQPVAPPRRAAHLCNPLVQERKLQQAEQTLRERGESITGERLATLAHVAMHVARDYARTHRDPAYEAEFARRAQQPLQEACAQLEAEGRPITVPALVRLTHLGSKMIGAFLTARAGNARERMNAAYQKLQAEGWTKIGTRRLSQAAQVSESRAKLFLREQQAPAQVASHLALPLESPQAVRHQEKGTDTMNALLTLPVTPPLLHFQSYALDGVLYGDQRLVLNLHERIVTLMDGYGEFDAQTCWSAPSLTLLHTLVEAHPAPCSQAALDAAWAGGIEVAAADELLTALVHVGSLDVVMRGLLATLSDCRERLSAFNLGIAPVPQEESYRLFRLSL